MNIVIDIRSHKMAFAGYFKSINEEWISNNFWLEENDDQILNDPQKYILDKGGNVFFALHNNNPVGTCALIVRDAITCELAKIAVDPMFQGHGIGKMLCITFIEKARQRGFLRIVLEGNTKMQASLTLYRKLGFKEIPLEYNHSNSIHHTRCNVFMEIILNPYNPPEYQI